MTLRERQVIFSLNISKLTQFIFASGYECTEGESYRTPEQAWLNALPKTSTIVAKTPLGDLPYTLPVGGKGIKKSLHMFRLAKDFNLFKDGTYLVDVESHRQFGEYWKTLHPDNKWGGDWGDGNHYSMTDNIIHG